MPSRFAIWLLFASLAILGWVLLALWEPRGGTLWSICLMRRTLALPCPGCGLTRAMAGLARGDWAAAVELHPMAPVVVAEGLAVWLAWGVMLWRPGRRALTPERLLALIAANYVALVALWVGRAATGTLPW